MCKALLCLLFGFFPSGGRVTANQYKHALSGHHFPMIQEVSHNCLMYLTNMKVMSFIYQELLQFPDLNLIEACGKFRTDILDNTLHILLFPSSTVNLSTSDDNGLEWDAADYSSIFPTIHLCMVYYCKACCPNILTRKHHLQM